MTHYCHTIDLTGPGCLTGNRHTFISTTMDRMANERWQQTRTGIALVTWCAVNPAAGSPRLSPFEVRHVANTSSPEG